MCTLSYIPNSDGFFLVNNRDESPLRALAFKPQEITLSGVRVLCPIDAEAKGTWIGVSNQNRFVCLMNGAFQLHHKKDSYSKSRGKVALEFLVDEHILNYFHSYDFEFIEPFTLIIIEKKFLYVLRWDGMNKHLEELDKNEAYQWSSATLYNQEVVAERLKYFYSHLSFFEEHNDALVGWHMNRLENSPPIFLNKTTVKTVSITTVHKSGGVYVLEYDDFINKKYTLEI
jgi:hypothetical protein